MDKCKFLELQYVTLRKEIEETKARIFRIVVGGSAAVPVVRLVTQAYEIDIATLVLPLLVIVVAFLFLAENNALMRCGSYIRKHIESQIQGIVGWETWEETETDFDVRAGDRYAVLAFYLLNAVYYMVCVVLAVKFARNSYGDLAGWVAGVIYGVAGIAVAFLLHDRIRLGTTTEGERPTDSRIA